MCICSCLFVHAVFAFIHAPERVKDNDTLLSIYVFVLDGKLHLLADLTVAGFFFFLSTIGSPLTLVAAGGL